LASASETVRIHTLIGHYKHNKSQAAALNRKTCLFKLPPKSINVPKNVPAKMDAIICCATVTVVFLKRKRMKFEYKEEDNYCAQSR
jgi:hypothetical protein